MKTTSPNPWLISQTVVFKGHLGLGQHIQMAYAPCAMATNISFMELLLEFALRSDRDARIGWRVRAEWARERGQLRGSSHARARWNARRREAVDGPRVFSSPRQPQPWPSSLTTGSEEVWVLVTRKDLL